MKKLIAIACVLFSACATTPPKSVVQHAAEHECVDVPSKALKRPMVACKLAELPTALEALNRHRTGLYRFEMMEPELTLPGAQHFVSFVVDPLNTQGLLASIERAHRMRVDHVDDAKRVIYLRRMTDDEQGIFTSGPRD